MDFDLANNFRVHKKIVGKDAPVFIIAEAGVSHFGDLQKALKLVDMAVDANADAVKFQIFKTEALISQDSPEWTNRLKSRELSKDEFKEVKKYCLSKKIIFISTAHDLYGLRTLDEIGVEAYKIGSGEVYNWEFIQKIAERQKPIFISTGMYGEKEIETALNVITNVGNKNIAVLHCTTAYPTPVKNVNLKAINTIKNKFNCITGYSDHTEGYHFPVAAVCFGAKIIEKHISLDFNIPNAQDWKVSCGPNNLKKMVKQIRDIEKGVGDGNIVIQDIENESLKWARKSIAAKRDILKGEKITSEMLIMLRPGTGISPEERQNIIGKETIKEIKKNMLIKMEDIK